MKFTAEFNYSRNALEILKKLPIQTSIENRWGDEIYFYTDYKLKLSGNAKETVDVGDIVYWRSKKSDKEAIAIFFGNTPKEDGTKPRAASSCDVIGLITSDQKEHEIIKKGDVIEMSAI